MKRLFSSNLRNILRYIMNEMINKVIYNTNLYKIIL